MPEIQSLQDDLISVQDRMQILSPILRVTPNKEADTTTVSDKSSFWKFLLHPNWDGVV